MRRHRASREPGRGLQPLASLDIVRDGRLCQRPRFADSEPQTRADRRMCGIGRGGGMRSERRVDAGERTGGRGAVRKRVGEQQRAPLSRERQAAEVTQQHVGNRRHRVQLTGRM